MTDRRKDRRYELYVPVSIEGSTVDDSPGHGETRDISVHGLYFTINQQLGKSAKLDITLALPSSLTGGVEVIVRAAGTIVRVDSDIAADPETQVSRMGIALDVEEYEIFRYEDAKQITTA